MASEADGAAVHETGEHLNFRDGTIMVPTSRPGSPTRTILVGLATCALALALAACAGTSFGPPEGGPPQAESTATPVATVLVGAMSSASAGSTGPFKTPLSVGVAERSDRPEYHRGRFVVVDNPLVIPGNVSTLDDADLVLGYHRAGEARAYPVGIVAYHHIVNDTVLGTPLLVTF